LEKDGWKGVVGDISRGRIRQGEGG